MQSMLQTFSNVIDEQQIQDIDHEVVELVERYGYPR
jgi:hypothetical protein